MKLLDSKELTIEIPSEKTIKSQEFGSQEFGCITFVFFLPIYLFLYNVHDGAAIAYILMILHIDIFLVYYRIELIITNRILFHVVHFIIMLLISLIIIISFGGSISNELTSVLIITILYFGILIFIAMKEFLQPLFFIERSFKVYEHTRKAEFFIKNNRWYLALFHVNGIEIYDVLKSNILIKQEEDFTLEKFTLKYYDTFIMTYSRIVENRDIKLLIKMWDVNTYKLVFRCIDDVVNRFFFTKNKKYLKCCEISSTSHTYNRGDYEDWHNYYSIKIWEIKNGQVIYDNSWSYRYDSYKFTDEELKSKIKDVLKSYKEAGELDELEESNESNEKENISFPYPIAISFPSCKKKYDGYIKYDMKKVRQDKFTEKATCIRVKIPLKELK